MSISRWIKMKNFVFCCYYQFVVSHYYTDLIKLLQSFWWFYCVDKVDTLFTWYCFLVCINYYRLSFVQTILEVCWIVCLESRFRFVFFFLLFYYCQFVVSHYYTEFIKLLQSFWCFYCADKVDTIFVWFCFLVFINYFRLSFVQTILEVRWIVCLESRFWFLFFSFIFRGFIFTLSAIVFSGFDLEYLIASS